MSRDSYGSTTGESQSGPAVGGFAVEAELGGSVLGRAYRTSEGGRAVRVLVLDREDYAWLLRTRYTESRVNLDLAGVRPLRDAVIDPGASFLIADVAPATLAEKIAKNGSRPGPQTILEIVRKATRIVASAHERGRVHGFLSLQDIEIDADDAVTVGGFGLAEVARRLASDLYEAHVARSLKDVAPEVRSAKKGAGSGGRAAATPRTDVYALGQILKRALGVPLAPSVLEVIERATAESPEGRYEDAGAFLAALEPITLADSSSEEPARGAWKTTLMAAATVDDEASAEEAASGTVQFGGKLFVDDSPARPSKPATPKTGKKKVTEAATLDSLDELEADAPMAPVKGMAPPPPPPVFAPPPPPPPPPPVIVPARSTGRSKPPAPEPAQAVADVLKHLEAIDAEVADKEPGSITGQLKVPSVLSDEDIDSGDILGDFHSLEDARAKRKRPDPKSKPKGKAKRKKPDDDLSALGNLDDLPILDDMGLGAASGDGFTPLGQEQAGGLGFDGGAVNPSFDDPNSSGNYPGDPFRDPIAAPPPPPPPRQKEPGTRPGKRTTSSKTKATGWASDDTLKGLAGDAPASDPFAGQAAPGGFDDPFGAPPPPAPAGFDPFGDPFASTGSQGFSAPAGDPFAGPPPGGGFGGDPFAPAAADPFAGPGGFSPQPSQGFGGDPFAGQQGGGFGAPADPFAGQQGGGFGGQGDPFGGQQGGGFGAPGGDPFGAPQQGGGFGGGDPFGAPQQGGGFGGGDPFGAPQQGGGFGGGDPFGAPQQGGGFGGGDPFGAPQQGGGFGGGDPFGAPQQGGGFGGAGGDPFGAPQQGGGFGGQGDPFGAPQQGGGFGGAGGDPFGAPQQGGGFGGAGGDPFGAPQQGGGFGGAGGDPFGAPQQGGGFGGAGGDPFGAPQQGGGFGGGDPFGAPQQGGGFGEPAPQGFDPFQQPGGAGGDPFAPPPPGAPASFGVTQQDQFGAPGGFGASPGFDDPFGAPSPPPRSPAFDPYAVTLGPTPQLNPGGDPFGSEGGAAGFDPFGSNASGAPGPNYAADNDDLAAMSAPTIAPQRFLPPASSERQAFLGSNDASPFDAPDAELDLGAAPPQRARGAFSLLIGGFQGPKKDKAAQVLAKLRTCSKNEALEALAANVVTVLEGVPRAQADQVAKLFQAIDVQVKITEKKG